MPRIWLRSGEKTPCMGCPCTDGGSRFEWPPLGWNVPFRIIPTP